ATATPTRTLHDALPISKFLGSPVVDRIFEYVTLKVGHMEINYGDAHFRRSDNGNAFYNPFIENHILDAFTTEIGGELYVRHAGRSEEHTSELQSRENLV